MFVPHWHLWENTRIGRSAVGTQFSSQIREGSNWARDRHERFWRRMVNVMQPTTSSSMTGYGGGSVMFLGGISFVGRTYLHVIAGCTLTAVRNWDEILGATVGPYTGAVGPGFLLVAHHATIQMHPSSLSKKPFSWKQKNRELCNKQDSVF